MTDHGSPLPTSAPNRRATWLSSMMLVIAAKAKSSGVQELPKEVAIEQAHSDEVSSVVTSCEPIYPASIFAVSRTFKSEFPPSPDHAARLVRALAFLGLLPARSDRPSGAREIPPSRRGSASGALRRSNASARHRSGEPLGGRPAASPGGRAKPGTARWHSGSIRPGGARHRLAASADLRSQRARLSRIPCQERRGACSDSHGVTRI